MGVRARLRRALQGMTAGAVPPRPMCYLGDHTALTTTVHGHKIYLDTRDRAVAAHLLMDGFWELWITDVFRRRLRPGASVIEVGANFGYYTLLAASLVGPGGRVLAFEANRDTYRLLQASIEVNGFLDRCRPVSKAVHEAPGALTFYKALDHSARSSLTNLARFSPEEPVTAETVEAVSLDAVLADDPRPVDFLKIDAEGSEPAIFRGARQLLGRSPGLEGIVEFSPELIAAAGEDPRAFVRDLLGHGFHLHVIRPGALVPVLSAEEMLGHGHCDVLLTRDPQPA